MRRRCLLNVVAILLQNATVITKCVGTRIFYFQHFLYEVHLLKSDHFVKSVQYGVFSGSYFPVLRLNTTGKYGTEKTPYLNTCVKYSREYPRIFYRFHQILNHINKCILKLSRDFVFKNTRTKNFLNIYSHNLKINKKLLKINPTVV